MKIILLGYMGSGKSTLGDALAAAKNVPFVDLDVYVATAEKMSVQDIFATKGEIYFRKKETFYLQEILQREGDCILSLGGGTPCFGNNMELIKAEGNISIYLKYLPKSLAKRLAESTSRPLLKELKKEDLEDFIRKHLFERNTFYTQATHSLAMDGLTKEESLQQILTILSNYSL
nr:shikimate kinase [uncultured Capnocytophaga sp.]